VRFGSPTDLINEFQRKQAVLQAEGWRPRTLDSGE
jgi:hypothetical protein